MIDAISACIIGGQLVLLTIGGQPVQEDAISLMTREPKPEMVSVNRVKEKLHYYKCLRNIRRRENTHANTNRNKYKSLKRRQRTI